MSDGLYAGQEVAARVAEGAHAVAVELGGEARKVDAGFLGAEESVLGFVCVDVQGTADVAVVGEGAQGGFGHGVDDVGGDEALDVEDVGVGGVLGAGAGPERSLRVGAGVVQRSPAVVGEAFAVAGVGAVGVGDRDATAEV